MAQFSILNSHPREGELLVAELCCTTLHSQTNWKIGSSNLPRIIGVAGKLATTFQGRHVAKQVLRSGTAGAANYGEARGAESRADFIHKMRIVQKELNETSVWLRVIMKSSLLSPELIVALVAENKELSRIVTASIRTARRRSAVPSDEN